MGTSRRAGKPGTGGYHVDARADLLTLDLSNTGRIIVNGGRVVCSRGKSVTSRDAFGILIRVAKTNRASLRNHGRDDKPQAGHMGEFSRGAKHFFHYHSDWL